jgi:hypothetical protein
MQQWGEIGFRWDHRMPVEKKTKKGAMVVHVEVVPDG